MISSKSLKVYKKYPIIWTKSLSENKTLTLKYTTISTKKKQKRMVRGKGGGGSEFCSHLSAGCHTNYSTEMSTKFVSNPNTSPPALRKAVFVYRIVSTKMCKLQSLSKTPARLNSKVNLRHFFDFFAHFCR